MAATRLIDEQRTTKPADNNTVIVKEVEELDIYQIGFAEPCWQDHLANGKNLILDMRQTNFIESTSVVRILRTFDRAKRAGLKVCIITSPMVERFLSIAKLPGEIVPTRFSTEEDAIGYMKN